MKPFKLDFSNRIIEHLGVKLYQNRPTNVIAEFVSNAWDADANNVEIDLKGGGSGMTILITDDGWGMSRDELTDQFLVIGRNRRSVPTQTSHRGRPLMGRKGIGKLAGFGIANTMDVLSAPNLILRADNSSNTKCYWLRFHLDQMVALGGGGSYIPETIADGVTPEELKSIIEANEGEFDRFLSQLGQGKGGVSIRLSSPTIKRTINPDQLLRSMGRRFTVTLLRPDFEVKVNSKTVTPADALPPMQDFKVGSWDAPVSEKILINGVEREVRFWISFVNLQDHDWSIENAGIGIYSHGKIAQDRPFFFGVKGKEILSRYMYGVLEADWLDDLPEDVVSTDRRSIDWEMDDAASLYDWGAKKLVEWIDGFREWRASLPRAEIVDKIRENNSKLTAPEEEALAELLADVFTDLGNNEEAKVRTTEKITAAWTHAPTRELTQSIWKEIFSGKEMPPDAFRDLIHKLQESLVPEALGLAVTMAQRIGAITALNEMIRKEKTETHLQRLIEKFPWLIDPHSEFLTANLSIRKLVTEKHKPNAEMGHWQLGENTGRLRPDFVFLSDPSTQREINVFELKGPECGKTLLPEEYDQLTQYLTIISRIYNREGFKVRGILVGHDKGGFEETDNRVKVRRWSEVLEDARHLHVSYLEALLRVSRPHVDDARIQQILDFGGEETKELLKRYAESETLPPEVLEEL